MYRVSGQPVGCEIGKPTRTPRLRNAAVTVGVALGILAGGAAATASRDTTLAHRQPASAGVPAIDSTTPGATIAARAGDTGNLASAPKRRVSGPRGTNFDQKHAGDRALSVSYPAIWNAAVVSIGRFEASPLSSFPVPAAEPYAPAAGTDMASLGRSMPAATAPRGMHVFGSIPLAASSKALRAMTDRVFAASRDWVVPEACSDRPASTACLEHVPLGWRTLFQEAIGSPSVEIARRVNAQVNTRITYASDTAMHGVREYWSRATETMESGAGDCEDFAILKMWLLARLGVKMEDMAVVVVRSDRLSTQHAVLALRFDEEIVVLDNLLTAPTPARELVHYVPVFSVNASGLWLHGFSEKQRVSAIAQ